MRVKAAARNVVIDGQKVPDRLTRAQESPDHPRRFPQGTRPGPNAPVMIGFISLELTGTSSPIESDECRPRRAALSFLSGVWDGGCDLWS